MKTFKANGKLLITAEYLVLKGAEAFAVPLNKGQTLSYKTSDFEGLVWKAFTPTQLWFEALFDNKLNIVETSDSEKVLFLQKVLQLAVDYNSNIIERLKNCEVITQLEFEPDWGWGSSSTLFYLLEQWLGVDAFYLMEKTIGGSGYDIACAKNDSPIIYQLYNSKPTVKKVNFNPDFIENLGIVFLNKKQKSSTEVKAFLSKDFTDNATINQISELTHKIISTNNLDDFMNYMRTHEKIISTILNIPPLENSIFSDFDDTIKSLGAWGGDFALFASKNDFQQSQKYFKKIGFDTVFRFGEVMI